MSNRRADADGRLPLERAHNDELLVDPDKAEGRPSRWITHRVHDLRHSTATYLLAAHGDPRVVMAVMGWSPLSMLTRYQHILPAMLDDAAARLEIALPLAR